MHVKKNIYFSIIFFGCFWFCFNSFYSSNVQLVHVSQGTSSHHILGVDRHTASTWNDGQVHKLHRKKTKMTSDPSDLVWGLQK